MLLKTPSYVMPFLIILLISGCFTKKNTSSQILKVSMVHKLKVLDPSGLSLTYSGKALWTVSDKNNTVYKISFGGKILSRFRVNGLDLEGITAINDSLIAVILERNRQIVLLTNSGKEIKRINLNLSGKPNSGLEGITFNPTNKHFYVLNEKYPRLFIDLDSNFTIVNKIKINFAKDLSGLFFDKANNKIWLVSDESKSIVITNTSGKMIKKYKIDIPQMEGITVDAKNGKIYLVSDSKEKLYEVNLNNQN